MSNKLSCSVCKKEKSSTTTISRCSRCKNRYYCGAECQNEDWRTHKQTCEKLPSSLSGPVWYDKHRRCDDGNLHEGQLELITWPCAKEGTGWGNCFAEESDDLKKKFEEEMGGDEEKFYEYWPSGFRWTCCGLDGGMKYGCDHHGTGSKPCTCDYCRGGESLPNSIFKEKTASRYGLTLQRGPDPRSSRRYLYRV